MRQRPGLWAAALAILALAPAWVPVLAGGETFYARDTSYYYAPQKAFEVGTARGGVLPTWNHALHLGIPHAANPTFGVLDPLNAVHHLLPGSLGVSVRALLSLLVLGLGCAWLARLLGAGRLGSAVSGVCAALCGPALGYLGNPFYLHGIAWLWLAPGAVIAPWSTWARAAGVGMGLALPFLAGDPQSAMVAGSLCGLLALFGGGAIAGRVRSLAAGAALAVLLALPQLVATFGLLGRSARRAGVGLDERWSMPVERLADLFVPAFFGRTLPEYSFFGGRLYPGAKPEVEPWLDSLHAGTSLALPLLVCALAAGVSREHRRRRVLLAVAAGVLLILALGPAVGVLPFLAEHIAPLSWFRYPEKYAAFAVLLLAVLSGAGIEALRPGRLGPRARVAAGGLALLLGLGAACLALAPNPPWVEALAHVPVAEPAARWYRLAGAPASAALLCLGLILVLGRAATAGARIVASLALIQAVIVSAALIHTAPRALLDHPVELARRLAGHGRAALDAALGGGNSLYRNEAGYVAQTARIRALLGSFGGEVPGVRLVAGYSAAFLDHEASSYAERTLYRRPEATFRWLGVQRYLTLDRQLPPHLARHLRAEPFSPAPGTRLYRVAFEAPIVRCPGGAVVAEEPLAHLDAHPELQPTRLARVRAPVAVGEATLPPEPIDAGARLEVSGEAPGRWTIRVSSERPCLLVVAENHDPGWRASLDGREVPVIEADAAFLSVAVPAGDHEVRLEHKPAHSALAGLGALAAAAALALLRRARRGRAASPRERSTAG